MTASDHPLGGQRGAPMPFRSMLDNSWYDALSSMPEHLELKHSVRTPEWPSNTVIQDRWKVFGFAQGGCGIVTFVEDLQWTGAMMAMKSFNPPARITATDERRLESLFQNECNIWLNLGTHPHVVSAFYTIKINNILRLFMEYVPGSSLGAILANQPGGIIMRRALDFAIQIAHAMLFVHDSNIVHRDLKPANCLISSYDHLRVTDFGLGRWDRDAHAGGVASFSVHGPGVTHRRMGTPTYMAPEQWQDDAMVSAATDVYAFGVMLHELIVGSPPFVADRLTLDAYSGQLPREILANDMGPATTLDVLRLLHLGAKPLPIARLGIDVPLNLEALIQSCLEKDPRHRPAFTEILPRLIALYKDMTGNDYPRHFELPPSMRESAETNRAISHHTMGNSARATEILVEVLRSHPRAAYAWANLNTIEILEMKRDPGLVQDTSAMLRILKEETTGDPSLIAFAQRLQRNILLHDHPVQSVHFDPTSQFVLTSTQVALPGKRILPWRVDLVHLWEIGSGQLIWGDTGYEDDETGGLPRAYFTTDGMFIIQEHGEKFRVYDALTRQVLFSSYLYDQGGAYTPCHFRVQPVPYANRMLRVHGRSAQLREGMRGAFLDGNTMREELGVVITEWSHSVAITAESFDMSGKWLVTGDVQGTCNLWSVSTGKRERTVQTDPVKSIRLAPDCTWLAVGTTTDKFVMVSLAGTSSIATFDRCAGAELIIGRSGRLGAIVANDRSILMSTATAEVLDTIPDRVIAIDDVHQRILTQRGSEVMLRSLDTQEWLRDPIQQARCATLSADGRLLGVGLEDGSVRVLPAVRQPVRELDWPLIPQQGEAAVERLENERQARNLCVKLDNGYVDSMAPLQELRRRVPELRADLSILETIHRAGLGFLAPKGIREFRPLWSARAARPVAAAAFCPDGERIAVVDRTGIVDLLRVQDGQLLMSEDGQVEDVVALAFCPHTGELRMVSSGGVEGRFSRRSLSRDGSRLLRTVRDGPMEVMAWEGDRVLCVLAGEEAPNCIAFSDDHRVVFGTVHYGTIGALCAWDAESGALLGRAEHVYKELNVVADIHPTSDGRRVYVACGRGLAQGTVRCWQVESGMMHTQFADATRVPSVISSSPDGRIILVGTLNTVEMWSANGAGPLVVTRFERPVKIVEYSPIGPYIFSVDVEGNMRMTSVDLEWMSLDGILEMVEGFLSDRLHPKMPRQPHRTFTLGSMGRSGADVVPLSMQSDFWLDLYQLLERAARVHSLSTAEPARWRATLDGITGRLVELARRAGDRRVLGFASDPIYRASLVSTDLARALEVALTLGPGQEHT